MSRLRQLRVPLMGGIDDRVAAAVLPDGALSDLKNGRFNRAGELALRRGWRSVVSDGLGATAYDLYSVDGQLVAFVADAFFQSVATLSDATAPRPWYAAQTALPLATDVRAVGGVSEPTAVVERASAALTPDGVYGCVLFQTSTETVYRVFRTDNDATVSTGKITPTADIDHLRKVVGVAGGFGLVSCDTGAGGDVQYQTFDPDAASPAWSATATMVAGPVTFFDATTARVTTPAAVHLAYVAGANVFYSRHDVATGALLGATTKTVAAAAHVSCAVTSDDVTVSVVAQDTSAAGGDLRLLTFSPSPPYTTSAGPTTLFSGAEIAEHVFSIGGEGTRVHVAAHEAVGGFPDEDVLFVTLSTAHVSVASHRRGTAQLTGGVISVADGSSQPSAGAYGISRDRTMLYTDRDPQFVLEYGTGSALEDVSDEPPFGVGHSAAGLWLVLGRQRGRTDGLQDVTYPAARLLRYGAKRRRPGAVLDGRLYLAGGMLTQYAGYELSENGMLPPLLRSATPSNSTGALTVASDYQYRFVFAWRDSRGDVHRSLVSLPENVSTGASDDTVTLSLSVPPTVRRARDLVADPWVEVYRTEAGPGELFYLTATATATSLTTDVLSVVDTTSDAALISAQRLYTEGDAGATSGVLDFTPPIPTAFVDAGRDRVAVAGADTTYQLSQTRIPGAPVAFTQIGISGPAAFAYLQTAEGPITGIATLDSLTVAGTATELFLTAGAGPNLVGEGAFDAPARLPSDVGFYDARSLIEDAAGLWFLAAPQQLYVLPRGQAAPAFAGELARYHFPADGAGEVVGAARDVDDSTTVWAVAGTSAHTLVVHDVAGDTWSADTLPFKPIALTTHEGRPWAVAENTGSAHVWQYAVPGVFGDGAAGATAVALQFATGDIGATVGGAPGLDGWGRVAEFGVEGVFQAAATLLAEISYDRGRTWTTLGSHTVTGLTTDEAFIRQWYPTRQRAGSFRVRVTMTPSSTTTEGCRLTGYTIGYVPRSGPSRLSSSKRR